MSKFMDSISDKVLGPIGDWFTKRTAQEQKILLLGIPVIFVLIIYLLAVQPLAQIYLSQKAELDTRYEDLSWIRDQRDLLERINTSCDARSAVYLDTSLTSDIEAAARRFGFTPQLRALPEADRFRLTLPSVQGNRVLSLTRALTCSGVSVINLELTSISADLREVNAVLELEYQRPSR